MKLFFGLFNLKVTLLLLVLIAGIFSVVIGNMTAIYSGLEQANKGNQRMAHDLKDNMRKMHDYNPK